MNTTAQIPATQNEDWGFFGTMGSHARDAWPLAIAAIARATGEERESVRSFLDSRFGRQFADDVLNALHDGKDLQAATDAATARWMGWTIGRETAEDYGIPRGLPYLTGFVIHCAICDEYAL